MKTVAAREEKTERGGRGEAPRDAEWPLVALAEVVDFESGEFLPRERVSLNGPVPVFGANGVIGYTTAHNFQDPVIAVGRVGSCGAVNVTTVRSWVTDNTIVLRPGDSLSLAYAVLFLRSRDLASLSSSSIQPLITQSTLRALFIPLPPLAEQERIAGRLTEQLAAVERARGAAQSRLAAAESLPAAYLREVTHVEDLSGDLPAGWVVRPLDEVCEFLDYRRRPVNETERRKRIAGKPQEALFPYFGANGQSGWIDEYLFDEPLILLAEDGGAFGSRHDPIAYTVRGKTWVNNHAHVLRPRDFMDFDFCGFALAVRPDLGEVITGATRPKLNQELAKAIPMPVPPLPDQRRIAADLAARLAGAERLAEGIRAELAAIEALPAALLREAFGGGGDPGYGDGR